MKEPSDQATTEARFRAFSVFSLIWAVTTLVHQLAFTFWTESWQGWVLVIGAIAVLFQPGCVLRFAFMVVASLLNLWHKLPFVPNHILYEGMLHVIMLLGLLGFLVSREGKMTFAESIQAWKPRLSFFLIAVFLKVAYFWIPGVPKNYLFGAITTMILLVATGRLLFKSPPVLHGEAFFKKVAPVLRMAVMLMYFWAAIQKMNWDYLDPEISCAAKLHIKIASYFGGLVPTAEWSLYGAIWGSLAFELGIPILLFISRTRFIGFIAAVWFHLWLAIHPAAGVYSFSSIILGLLALFIPISWGEKLQESWSRQLTWLGAGDEQRGRRRAVWGVTLLFFATLITQGAMYLTQGRDFSVFETANRIGFVAFYTWGCWIGFCYLQAGWRSRGKPQSLPNKATATIAWAGLVLVLFNGVFPWVGGRTQTSFSMYSNLKSEGDGNHVFLKRVDLFPYQKDMITVVQSKPDILLPTHRPKGIQQFANPGHTVLPWFEFRRLLSEFPEGDDVSVEYIRAGETETISRVDGLVTGEPSAFEKIPTLKRKFIWFRRLNSIDGPMPCTH